ncbi:hypothetical protein [Hoeflea olei]|uniref:ORC-CDC6 family AAA ATPase n=1 Tax=Hoeflea olei TaxID=1480615 RepID=UPI000AFEAB44|nr:hypothetical protein [Hoeflea olei]
MTESLYFDAFNAKHKSDREIASSFVPPSAALSRLITKGHVVVSGPRGSGKTTLLKMLTIPALCNWHGDDADAIKSRVNFVSVFVAADRSWHGQLNGLGAQIGDPGTAELLGMSTFTTHIFKAIVISLMEWRNPEFGGNSLLGHLIPGLSLDQERELVTRLAGMWQVAPRAPTFFELKSALSERLADIGALKNRIRYSRDLSLASQKEYLFLDYKEGMRQAASVSNEIGGLPARRWAFLFDEIEVAPSFIQESLFLDLRSASDDPNITYKLALAPFNKNFRNYQLDIGASQKNDYTHIDLSFPRKEISYEFSRRLAESILKSSGIEASIEQMFGTSYFSFEDEGSADDGGESKYAKDKPLGKVFNSLADKDSSFRNYLQRRGVNLGDVSALNEAAMAKTLRKARNIVVIREYFSRPSKSSLLAERLSSRSRKSFGLYAGLPSILTLTEGNPRALINLLSPLIAEYRSHNETRSISEGVQAIEIEKSIRVMRSLLKTVPVRGKLDSSKGLLSLLDTIGEALYNNIVATKFRDQPPLSFRVDRGVHPDYLSAIGKAINIGAIIYIPDQASDEVISDVVGKRFRLNYLLSAYYKLPLSFDREASLSSLLGSNLGANQTQMEFTDEN